MTKTKTTKPAADAQQATQSKTDKVIALLARGEGFYGIFWPVPPLLSHQHGKPYLAIKAQRHSVKYA